MLRDYDDQFGGDGDEVGLDSILRDGDFLAKSVPVPFADVADEDSESDLPNLSAKIVVPF